MPEELNQDQSVDIRRRIFRIESLAAMPQVVWRILEAIGDERSSAATMEGLLESDPALAAKVLKLANSVYYSLVEPATTIRRAVMVIGFQELEVLVVSAGLSEIFGPKLAEPGSTAEALWRHCLAVSHISRDLAERINYPSPSELMLAGLLHDLGKLVLLTHFSEEYDKIEALTEQGVSYGQAEAQLGLQHTLLGYWLAIRWQLPGVHASAIRDHHAPREDDPYYPSTCLVFLANRLAKTLKLGLVQESRDASPQGALKTLGLTREDLKDAAKHAPGQVEAMVSQFKHMLKLNFDR
jgi:putative nucleotidyltransferase with HDIG domain